MAKEYDLLLFGCTGYTGALAIEHLSTKRQLKWAVSARSTERAQAILTSKGCDGINIEMADLVAAQQNDQAYEQLRAILKKTSCAISTAGPFDKYGKALVALCAEEGVHYADITGQTDFFREMIREHDAVARETGANIVCHCGNDCIPWDLTVLEMHDYARARGAHLKSVTTYTEVPDSGAGGAASGGTLTPARGPLAKSRDAASRAKVVDPLLRTADGAASEYKTKVTSPKSNVRVVEFRRSAGPWVMGPVMANCIRRSNALNGYAKGLVYSEALLRPTSWSAWAHDKLNTALFAGALYFSPLRRFLYQPGEGPTRAELEASFLTLHGRGVMVDPTSGAETELSSTYHFDEDTGYLDTAKMLVEAGIMLARGEGSGSIGGGVATPAVVLGAALTKRLEVELGAKLTLGERVAK